MYVNTAHEVFQKQQTASNPNFPKDWNPLKSLRSTLLHEFNHVISQPTTDITLFSLVDSRNEVTDKKVEGFQIKGFTGERKLVALFNPIEEASAELLSKYINIDLFHSFISDYPGTQGNVTSIMIRLEKLLDSAGIDKILLARLHQTSDLKGFLLLLSERYGLNPQKISERDRIIFGFSLFEALVQNNQTILQDYMYTARRLPR